MVVEMQQGSSYVPVILTGGRKPNYIEIEGIGWVHQSKIFMGGKKITKDPPRYELKKGEKGFWEMDTSRKIHKTKNQKTESKYIENTLEYSPKGRIKKNQIIKGEKWIYSIRGKTYIEAKILQKQVLEYSGKKENKKYHHAVYYYPVNKSIIIKEIGGRGGFIVLIQIGKHAKKSNQFYDDLKLAYSLAGGSFEPNKGAIPIRSVKKMYDNVIEKTPTKEWINELFYTREKNWQNMSLIVGRDVKGEYKGYEYLGRIYTTIRMYKE